MHESLPGLKSGSLKWKGGVEAKSNCPSRECNKRRMCGLIIEAIRYCLSIREVCDKEHRQPDGSMRFRFSAGARQIERREVLAFRAWGAHPKQPGIQINPESDEIQRIGWIECKSHIRAKKKAGFFSEPRHFLYRVKSNGDRRRRSAITQLYPSAFSHPLRGFRRMDW